MKAEFIIVGVMKSGTTTLAHHLSGHPGISIPRNEVHFFDYDHKFSLGTGWYEKHFDEPGRQIAGEKTPYSFYPYTAERIFQYNKQMKLLWIFRNPVDRTYSNYTHDLYNIDEWRSFEKCIKQEEKRNVLYQYLSKGRYVEQVENYLRFFSKEQMHFVFFEELIRNPEKCLEEVFRFLGVGTSSFSAEKELHSKKSLYPKYSPALLYFYKKWIGQGGRTWNFLWRKNFTASEKQSMKSETRKMLIEYYKPFNLRMGELLGKDLSYWNK